MTAALTAIKRRIDQAIPRRRAAVVAMVLAFTLFPATEALAFYAVTGTGTISGAQVSSTATTVSISIGGGTAFTYGGGSTSNLVLGGNVTFPLRLACLTSCPATVAHVNLSSFTSDKALCNSTSLPGAFTSPGLTPVPSIIPASSTDVGNMTVTYVNLAADQSACLGATVNFVLSAS